MAAACLRSRLGEDSPQNLVAVYHLLPARSQGAGVDLRAPLRGRRLVDPCRIQTSPVLILSVKDALLHRRARIHLLDCVVIEARATNSPLQPCRVCRVSCQGTKAVHTFRLAPGSELLNRFADKNVPDSERDAVSPTASYDLCRSNRVAAEVEQGLVRSDMVLWNVQDLAPNALEVQFHLRGGMASG